ncbi:SagB/ThcOx family dehydrogenase [Streptomyces sp. QHH-9511]|uniref:SagB family peptide dehydrogenase n=1 Tax=Streptomyces sp. QHH-9511 TaxID=2684468 RepID=UPI001316CB62|nr:SagB family peptide dehydrogenase [Streptomyces sp. QHH-9511]QGZ47067.1 SagB/ThcOx family dehydrogenase [Streptomyces sp. QHH-9511]
MDWFVLPDLWRTRGLAVQARLRPEVAVEAAENGELTVRHWWGAARLTGTTAVTASALRRLNEEWTDSHDLLTGVASSGRTSEEGAATPLAELLWACQEFAFLIELRLVAGERSLLTVKPASYAARLPVGGLDPTGRRLSRFAFLHRGEEGLELASATSAHRVLLQDEETSHLVTSLVTEPVNCSGPASGTADVVCGLLAGIGMLEGTETEGGTGTGEALLHVAEFPDLLVHQRSRFGSHDGGFGAEFPFLGRIDPSPAVPHSAAEGLINLPVPDAHEVRARDLLLSDAIESRCSLREYSDEPLTLAELGEFLFRCARIRGRYGPTPEANMPYQASDRPFPSGGGVHDLELYPLVTRVTGLEPGAYRYSAAQHALERVAAPAADFDAVLHGALRASSAASAPPVLFKIVSRFERMAWKYRSIGYATTLKNVGGLYQTMYLVATAMGLAPCALGSGEEVAGARLLGASAASELGVGEFILGRPVSTAAVRTAVAHRRGQPTWRPYVSPDWGFRRD